MSEHNDTQHETVGHIVPFRILLLTWIALIVLTYITVAVTKVDLGFFNLWLAMIIATIKASLVALYFMHLRYDQPFNAILLIGSLLFVMLFVAFTMMDTMTYHPNLIPGYAPEMNR